MLHQSEIKENWKQVFGYGVWEQFFKYYHWEVPTYWYEYSDKKTKEKSKIVVPPKTRYSRKAKKGYEYLQNDHSNLDAIIIKVKQYEMAS